MAEATVEAPTQRVHAIAHGRVQGVNYRAYTANEATRLGLVGWVRNKPDGTVEAVAEGSRERLEAFVNFLYVGSPHCSVSAVEVTWLEADGDLASFVVRYF